MNRTEQIKKQLENFTGDKRTKEYKDLKKELKALETSVNKYIEVGGVKYERKEVTQEEYNFIQNLPNPISWEDLKQVFKINNRLYNKKDKPCRCPVKIKKIINKLKKITYYGK